MVVFGSFVAVSNAAVSAELRARKAARSNCRGVGTAFTAVTEPPVASKPVVLAADVAPVNVDDFLIDCGEVLKRKGAVASAGRYTRSVGIESELAVAAKVLGCGKSGSVKVGRWHHSDARCAVKTFSKKHLDMLGRVDLKNEIETYLSVDHPHIATLERVFETEADVHIVMECLEGGELFDRLAQRRFSEDEAADAVRQMLLATAYLHGHGIVHRDIKLENFVYEAEGGSHLKLIDFGFARFFSAGSPKMLHAKGTLHYMAPESLQRCYTEKADLWSMGISTFMLLCGCVPWSRSKSETMQMIAAGRPHLWPSIFDPLGAEAKDFVRSLLTADPERRLSAAQALEHPWLRQSLPVSAPDAAVMRSLQNYSQATCLRRSCIAVSVWSLSAQSQASVRGQFLGLANRNGAITATSLHRALEESGLNGAEAQEIFRILDANGDGEISWSEFLSAAAGGPEVFAGEADALHRAFRRFGEEKLGDSVKVDGKRVTIEDFCAFMKIPLACPAPLAVAESLDSSLSSRVQSFNSLVSVGSMEQSLCEEMSSNCCLVGPGMSNIGEARKQSTVCISA